ncbi:MAG: OmpA family protein [Flavobacteriales bacterium]|nr:OmpA family protein [Flavobacteriales bacterium]
MIFRIVVLLSFCIFLSSRIGYGQDKNDFSTDYIMGGGEAELLEDAEWFFGIGDYRRALPIFVKLNLRYPGTNVYQYYAGICYLEKTDEQDKSIDLLETAYSVDPKLIDILFYLGRAYMVNYKFDEAIGYFILANDKKKTSAANRVQIARFIEQCENAKALTAKKPEQVLVLENLGPPVNTENDEYVPLLSADESVMIYTYKGKRSRGGLINIYGEPDPDGRYYEDIFSAYRLGNTWLDSDPLGPRVNSDYHDASVALAPDGLSLFIYKDENGGDIYISRFTRNSWDRPEPVPGKVNTKHYEGHVSISVDERTLFFVSDRPGGFGGQDIYQATLQEDETWGDIVNLGPDINTPYDEDAPFIHANGELLYFSSKGHNSMGGFDIFYATLKFGKWVAPDNIGPPVNTPNDDNFYVVSASGERAYFSSGRAGGYGGQDIYVVKPGVFGKKPVLAVIKGVVKNNGRVTPTDINITNTSTNEPYGAYKANASSGNYLITLPPGSDYKLDFMVKGEVVHSENVDITDLNVYVEVAQDFELSAKKNPLMGSSNALQVLLDEKLTDIETAKLVLELEQKLSGPQDSSVESTPGEIVKLYLLDQNGEVLMTSLKDEKGEFNFAGQEMQDYYSMLLDASESDVDEEVIVLITDKDGTERLITTWVIHATEEEVALLEGTKVLVTPEAMAEAKEEARINLEQLQKRKAAARRVRLVADAERRLFAVSPGPLTAQDSLRIKAEAEALVTKEEEIRIKSESEVLAQGQEEARTKKEEEAQQQALAAANAKKEREARLKAEVAAQAKEARDEESRLKAEAAALADAAEEAQLNAEALGADDSKKAAKVRAEAEALAEQAKAAQLKAEEAGLAKAEAQARDLELAQQTTSATSKFDNLLFDFNKSTLRTKSKKELDALLIYLSKNTTAKIVIAGHADAIGTHKYNMKLSEQRTQRAAAYLIQGGANESQLLLYAFGKTRPVAANANNDGTDNPSGRQLNRRAEFSATVATMNLKGGKLIAFSRKKARQSGYLNGLASTKGIFYKVQVAAYKHPENYKHGKLDDLGTVASRDVNGIARFTLGRFDNLKEARQFKKLIVKRGTADAFITAEVDGKRKYLHELGRPSAPTSVLATAKVQKPISPAAMAAYRRIMNKFGDEIIEGMEFNVQVAAYKHAENYSSKKATGLGNVKSKKLDDSITRFTIGSFKTLKEAENFRKKVLDTGINDAFVTAKYNGNRVLVKDLIANNFYML